MKIYETSTQQFGNPDTKIYNKLLKPDKELHQEFLKLGANRRKLTNELLALLPEIFDRKIYLKYSSSVVEYAGKFGGLSKGVVIKRLRLEKYLSDKPKLRDAIKTEGVHKVALVASVATAETEEAWVDKLKNMSKNAIQELSKEVRIKKIEAENGNFGEGGLFSGSGEMATLSTPCKAAPLKITIELTDESVFLFLKLKKELEKASKKDSGAMRILSNKEAMNEILKKLTDAEFSAKNQETKRTIKKTQAKLKNEKVILEDGFCEEKVVAKNIEGKVILEDGFCEEKRNSSEKQENISRKMEKSQQKISRYIPIHIKKMAISSTHGKCAYPNCGQTAEIFHHRERFAESKNHQSIVQLCKIHHEFAHNGIITNESQNIEQWNFKINENDLSKSDISYREVRLEALR